MSTGWLIVASRRETFPTAQDTAAIHIAASLADTARKMRVYADRQHDVIRATIFDEALDLHSVIEAPELTNRILASGIAFDRPLRVVSVLDPTTTRTNSTALSRRGFDEVLASLDILYLRTSRNVLAVYLVQSDTDSLQRAIRANRDALRTLRLGIGREINVVSDIADSFADSLLAQKTLESRRGRDNFVAFEEFDFATRLFADVGLTKLFRASREYLAPIIEKEPIFDALRQYFVYAQNANATADALGIHHNTLRYRLSKVEELMDIRLNDPSAIASVFLAITAIELAGERRDGESAPGSVGAQIGRGEANKRRQLPLDEEPRSFPPFGAKVGWGDVDSL
jgi:hypothetical protein